MKTLPRQVHFMAEFQAILDFPPAPKLGIDGRLDPRKASEPEMRGQELFFGKAKCATCHAPPYYTDLTMHNLQAERFFKPRLINGRMASHDGPIKTFPLRGIKDSPPYNARRPAADARGHGRVFQSRARDETHR